MKPETTILKGAILLLATTITSFFILVIPTETDIQNAGEFLPMLLTIYTSVLPFLFALFQTFKILTYMDQGKGFSKLTVEALEKIKYSAAIFAILYALLIPLFILLTQMTDAPGVLMLGLILSLGPIVIATFVSLLQKSIRSVIKE